MSGEPTGPRLNEAAFRTILDAISIPVLVIEPDGTIAYVGGSVERDLGYSRDAALGRNIIEFLPPDQVEEALDSMAQLEQYEELGIGVPSVFAVVKPDGSSTWQAIGAVPLHDDPDVRGTVLYFRDWDSQLLFDESFAALLAAEPLTIVLEKLAHSIQVSLESVGVGIHYGFEGGHFASAAGHDVPHACLYDNDGPLQRSADSGSPLYLGVDALSSQAARAAKRADIAGVWVIPLPRTEAMQPAVLSVWRQNALSPLIAHRFVMTRSLRYVQLTLLRSVEHAQLAHLATHDPLTGAANRSLFNTLLAEALDQNTPAVVLFCDLDSFKTINDSFGHVTGDEVLRAVAARISGALRGGDELARVGGDEFIVLLHGSTEDGIHVANRILAAMDRPIAVDSNELTIQISIGIAATNPGSTPDSVLTAADEALYAAKRGGRGGYRIDANSGGEWAVWDSNPQPTD